MVNGQHQLSRRVLSGIDLAIDLATLGEYGLTPLPANGPCRERPGRRSGWEALATARRGACDRSAAPVAARARRSGPDWGFPPAPRRRGVDFRGAIARYAGQ